MNPRSPLATVAPAEKLDPATVFLVRRVRDFYRPLLEEIKSLDGAETDHGRPPFEVLVAIAETGLELALQAVESREFGQAGDLLAALEQARLVARSSTGKSYRTLAPLRDVCLRAHELSLSRSAERLAQEAARLMAEEARLVSEREAAERAEVEAAQDSAEPVVEPGETQS